MWRLIKATIGLLFVATWPLWQGFFARKRHEQKEIQEHRRGLQRATSDEHALRTQRLITRNFVVATVVVQCPSCNKAYSIAEERYAMREYSVCPTCAATWNITPGP